jgi:DTW domain-containing protein
MSSFEPREVCQRCRRPVSVCYCQYLTRIETTTSIVLLQHPRERDMPIGTAHMASLCLPNSRLLVGFDWQNSNELARLLADPSRPPALLYPGDSATDLNSLQKGARTLVVVDGTWANTRKMVNRNPVLANLPRVAFRPERASEYRIRREPNVDSVSTIEALMYVLGALEGGTERFADLLLPFRKMIDAQLACQKQRGTARTRQKRRPKSGHLQIPAELLDNGDRIVCVGGEANAWPCRDLEQRAQYSDELVQWVAHRLSTGESFECFVAPRNPLSPSTPAHLSLDAEVLHRGGGLETLLFRWRSFVREDDIVCSWGRYATSLFAGCGGYLPPQRHDLRLVTKNHLKRALGTQQEFYDSLETTPGPALGSGRAGVRLEQLTQIARYLCQRDPNPA